jgi:integrase
VLFQATDRDETPFNLKPEEITQQFRRVCQSAGIKNFRFHDLRHEATSRLFEKGLSIVEVSAITGHRTLEMLNRYTHLKPEMLAQKLNMNEATPEDAELARSSVAG